MKFTDVAKVLVRAPGCVMSLTLFKLYLNDLPKAVTSPECDPVRVCDVAVGYLSYADDLLLISQCKSGFQVIKHIEHLLQKVETPNKCLEDKSNDFQQSQEQPSL